MKNYLKKAMKYVTDEDYRFLFNNRFEVYNRLSDEEYLKRLFKANMGYDLNLDNPKTFNEKLQWLKLYDRKPEYTMMVDKYMVKKYVADKIGEEYIIPTLGVWDNPDEIDFDELPEQFVLKCNHNSGVGMCICKDKSKLDIKKVKKELKKGLKQDYYLTGREWPYKNVERKIIAEKYMEDSKGEFIDYKFNCFNGDVDNVMMCCGRATGNTKFYFFDKNWNFLRLNKRGMIEPENFTFPKPQNLDGMFNIAAELSQNFSYVRVDLYNLDGKIYFGELTFFPESGFDYNLLKTTDDYFGGKINLNMLNNSN